MFLQTKLLPVGNDGYVYVCGMTLAGVAADDLRDTRHVQMAYRGPGAADAVDLTAVCTAPRPASAAETGYLLQTAKTQQKLAEDRKTGRNAGAEYRKNADRYRYQAQLAETDRLWLPARIAASHDGKLLVGVCAGDARTLSFDGWLRLIDARSGEVLLEQTRHATDLATGPRALAEFIAFGACATRALFYTVEGRRVRVVEQALTDGLPETAVVETLTDPGTQAVSLAGHWVVTRDAGRGSEVLLIEHGRGRPIGAHKVRGLARSLAVARDKPLAAVGRIGGAITLLNLETGDTTELRPHVGLRRDDWITVALSADGRWLASAAGQRLALTRLEDGRSQV